MEKGLVSPALCSSTPSLGARQSRVTDATTLYKAQKNSCTSSERISEQCTIRHETEAPLMRCTRPCKRSCGALAVSAGAKAKSSSRWCARPKDSYETWECH